MNELEMFKEPILPDLRIAEVSTCPSIQFFNVDCMEFMRSKPDKFYDLAIVDPPYGINIAKEKPRVSGRWNYTPKTWDKDPPTEVYFNELFRISKNQIIWGGNYFACLGATRGFIIWDKEQPVENFADCEFAWTSFDCVSKTFRYPIIKQNFAKEKKIHPTQKPVQLYRWILKNYAESGWKVLDTHGGSMSTSIACDMEGYDLDICEIDLEYFTNGVKRFKEYKSQQRLF